MDLKPTEQEVSGMEAIKNFLIFITTPGSEMPASVTVPTIFLLLVLAILLPKIYRWLYDRRHDPRNRKKDRK